MRQRTWGIEPFAFYGVRYLSQVGQSLFLAALLLIAGRGAAAPLGLSSVFAATLAAAVVFGLPGGALADRLGPGRGLALGALLRLGALAAALTVAGHVSYVWVAAFVYSAASQVFSPAEMALVPLVERRAAARAHSLLVGLQYAGQGSAMLAVPLLLVVGGPRLMLVAAAAVYVAVSLVAAALATRLRPREAGYRAPAHRAFAFGGTFRFFLREPRAAYAVGLLTFTDITTKSLLIAVPVYLKANLGLSRPEIISLLALGVAGAGLGLLWTGRSLTPHSAARAMRLTLTGMVVALLVLVVVGHTVGEVTELSQATVVAAFGAAPSAGFVVVSPVALVLGLCFSIAPIGARAVLTETAPAGQQARVFAAQALVTHALVVLPLLLAGAGTQSAGPRATLAVVGVAGLLVMAALEAFHLHRRAATPLAAITADGGA